MNRSRASAWMLGLLAAGLVLAVSGASAEPQAVQSAATAESPLVRAVGRLEPVARGRFLTTFAGVWLGTGRDAGKVFIAFTSRARPRADSLRGRLPKPDRGRLRILTFKRSLLHLEMLELLMSSDREVARRGKISFPAVPGGLYDLDVDIPHNIVVVTVQHRTQATVDAFRQRYGSSVVVVQGHLIEPQACNREDCGTSIRGGLRDYRAVDATHYSCTTGFTVREQVRANPRLGVLSAAHCPGGPGAPRYRPLNGTLQQYGTVVSELQKFAVDAEWHTVNPPFTAATACVYVSSKQDCAYAEARSRKLDEVPIGLKVCKSGATTGITCGYVLSKDASPTYVADAAKFVKTSMCSEPGDSGAPVFAPDTRGAIVAEGILSGSPDYPCGDSRDRVVFSHLEFIEKELNVRVITQDILK